MPEIEILNVNYQKRIVMLRRGVSYYNVFLDSGEVWHETKGKTRLVSHERIARECLNAARKNFVAC